MNDNLRTRFASIKKQLEHLSAIQAELPELREKLGEDLFQFERLEARVTELDAQVKSLESFSFASIASAFAGKKQQQLTSLKEELGPLTEEYGEAIESLNSLNEQVQSMEQELEELQRVRKEYEQASDELVGQLRQEGGDAAGQLAEVDDHLEQVKAEHRTLCKAVEAAEQTEHHLDSMTRSLGSAQNKMMYRSPLGAVGQVVHAVYTQRQTKGPIRLVRQGVERLKRHIDALPLEEDIEANRELRRISVSLAETAAKLSDSLPAGYFCDMSVTLPIKQEVRAAQNACSHLRDELTPQLEALKEQRLAILESVL